MERDWLGLVAPPLKQRLADLGWLPDTPAAYCRRCAHSVGPHEADHEGCPRCRGKRLAWDRIVRLGPYVPPLRGLIHELKFTRFRPVGHELGLMLGRRVAWELGDAAAAGAAVVPVPASRWRRLWRGIDHAAVIARGVARAMASQPPVQALRRRHGPSQTDLPASRRAENVAGAFAARGRAVPAEEIVVLVDDVTTTRATLRAAARALQEGRRARGLGPAGIVAAVLASAELGGSARRM